MRFGALLVPHGLRVLSWFSAQLSLNIELECFIWLIEYSLCTKTGSHKTLKTYECISKKARLKIFPHFSGFFFFLVYSIPIIYPSIHHLSSVYLSIVYPSVIYYVSSMNQSVNQSTYLLHVCLSVCPFVRPPIHLSGDNGSDLVYREGVQSHPGGRPQLPRAAGCTLASTAAPAVRSAE